jgi:hypothetical protein
MFDAGIISRPEFSSNRRSPEAIERISTAQTPRSFMGELKMVFRSARSSRIAGDSGGAAVVTG